MSAAAVEQSSEPVRKISGRSSRSVLLLAPQIYAHGGVQSYMRRLATIVTAYSAGSGHTCIPLALGRNGHRESDGGDPAAAAVIDAGGSKLRLVANAFRSAAGAGADLAVVGHIGLGPLALALKTCGLIRSYIVVLHGIEVWQRLSFADRYAARNASLAVATTHFTARRFAAVNGYPIDRIPVVPLALGEEDFTRPPFPPRQGALQVLTVGRLARCERYKGVDYLIDAVAALAKEGISITLDIVGDGDDAPALKQRAASTGAAEAIRFHGSVSDERLRDFYRSCDVFAMPSLNEGFGIVFLEAMRFGKPCIGGRHGGTPEVIEHGVNGFLVEHASVDQLIVCLRHLDSDPDLCLKLGERAYQTVTGKYRLSRMQSDWFDVLEMALRPSDQVDR
jgi:phosphatidylinositol alpha-1,6-mannosyltransferase